MDLFSFMNSYEEMYQSIFLIIIPKINRQKLLYEYVYSNEIDSHLSNRYCIVYLLGVAFRDSSLIKIKKSARSFFLLFCFVNKTDKSLTQLSYNLPHSRRHRQEKNTSNYNAFEVIAIQWKSGYDQKILMNFLLVGMVNAHPKPSNQAHEVFICNIMTMNGKTWEES